MQVLGSNSHAAATGEQTASTVMLPYPIDLKEDDDLQCIPHDFERTIKNYYGNRKSSIEQLKATFTYPTPHVLAQFAYMAYDDKEEPIPPEGWELLATASNPGSLNCYFGKAYWHPEHQQVVISHRGTDINVGADINADDYVAGFEKAASAFTGVYTFFRSFPYNKLVISRKSAETIFNKIVSYCFTDSKGVVCNNYVPQMRSASTFANKVVAVLQEIQQEKNVDFEIFFTGHSLGGWLAQITAFTTQYLEVERGIFRKKRKTEEHEPLTSSTVQDGHDVRQNYHPHTVAFDSPGCKDMLSIMADKHDVRYYGKSTFVQHLDITSYLSAPNRINTCNSHLGTVYRIFTDLSDMDLWDKHTLLYNLATHRMNKIVRAFDHETGQVSEDKDGRLKIQEVADWPVTAGLWGVEELKEFFESAKHHNNYHPDVKNIVPKNVPEGYCHLRYQTKAYEEREQSLRVFTKDAREFLDRFRWFRDTQNRSCSITINTEAEEEVEQTLGDFNLLKNERIWCPDASKLHDLIPYLTRLVRLFPRIKVK
jgi:hypothetical protein